MMYRLKHSRVVELLGVIIEDGNYSLVMEYMEKGNLMQVLKAKVQDAGHLPSVPGAGCGPRPGTRLEYWFGARWYKITSCEMILSLDSDKRFIVFNFYFS